MGWIQELLRLEVDKDNRTLRAYLDNVLEVERKGLYPEYSKKRRFIIMYWEKAIKSGLVNLEDRMHIAVEKMRRAEQNTKIRHRRTFKHIK